MKMSEVNKWRILPNRAGMYWFTPDLNDRDLAQVVGVESVEYGNGDKFFRRSRGNPETPILNSEGWWLRITDERLTAEVIWPGESE
jgi:hypothetical protein